MKGTVRFSNGEKWDIRERTELNSCEYPPSSDVSAFTTSQSLSSWFPRHAVQITILFFFTSLGNLQPCDQKHYTNEENTRYYHGCTLRMSRCHGSSKTVSWMERFSDVYRCISSGQEAVVLDICLVKGTVSVCDCWGDSAEDDKILWAKRVVVSTTCNEWTCALIRPRAWLSWKVTFSAHEHWTKSCVNIWFVLTTSVRMRGCLDAAPPYGILEGRCWGHWVSCARYGALNMQSLQLQFSAFCNVFFWAAQILALSVEVRVRKYQVSTAFKCCCLH